MKKYIAVQVNPEYQESPLLLDIDDMEGTYLDGLCFWGNNDYKARINKEFEILLDNLDEATEDYMAIVENQDWKNFDTIEEIVRNYFFSYEEEDWEEWRKLFNEHYEASFVFKPAVLIIGLTLLTGKTYAYKTISGSTQSEWNYIFFAIDDWTYEQIKNIEIEYFNEGEEYIITIEPVEEDTNPEDIYNFDNISVYVHGWDDDMNWAELAEVNGCKPEEIIMYKYITRTIADYIRV